MLLYREWRPILVCVVAGTGTMQVLALSVTCLVSRAVPEEPQDAHSAFPKPRLHPAVPPTVFVSRTFTRVLQWRAVLCVTLCVRSAALAVPVGAQFALLMPTWQAGLHLPVRATPTVSPIPLWLPVLSATRSAPRVQQVPREIASPANYMRVSAALHLIPACVTMAGFPMPLQRAALLAVLLA